MARRFRERTHPTPTRDCVGTRTRGPSCRGSPHEVVGARTGSTGAHQASRSNRGSVPRGPSPIVSTCSTSARARLGHCWLACLQAPATNALPEISIPGNENLCPETFGRTDLQSAAETADWRPQTEFPGAKPRKCRPIPDARKLRQFGATGWWSGMDSNQRYGSPYCLPRSQRRPYHRNPTLRAVSWSTETLVISVG